MGRSARGPARVADGERLVRASGAVLGRPEQPVTRALLVRCALAAGRSALRLLHRDRRRVSVPGRAFPAFGVMSTGACAASRLGGRMGAW